MHKRRWGTSATAVVVALALGAALSGCTATTSEVIAGSTVSVGVDQPFTSTNSATGFGRTEGNAAIAYATGSGFSYPDSDGAAVADTSFGSYEKLSDDPLVVRYTVADGVRWSDGTPVDGADLLLAWAAASGSFNDPEFESAEFIDRKTGAATEDYPADAVYFDSGADRTAGLGLATAVPQLSEDRASITVTFDAPGVDWRSAFLPLASPPLPAHVVARHALGVDDPQAAKAAVVAAIFEDDAPALAALSKFWNTGFNLEQMPEETDLLVSSGPYVITEFVAGQYVTLKANPLYAGSRRPTLETVTVRYIADPLAATQALLTGQVDVITPQPTAEVVAALGKADLTVVNAFESTVEHLDLQFADSKSGDLDDPLVRRAFLKTIPRAAIVDLLVAPVKNDATPRNSFLFTQGTEDYQDTVVDNGSAEFVAVDIPGAKALLKDAGVKKPRVCILFAADDDRRTAEFDLIAASAKRAGFVVKDCSSTQWKTRLGVPGTYDAAIYASASSDAAAVYATDGARNFSHYSNTDVDSLLAQLAGSTDADARARLLAQVDVLLWGDSYGAPLFQYPALTAYDQRSVRGIDPVAFAPGVFWNIWDWTPPNVGN